MFLNSINWTAMVDWTLKWPILEKKAYKRLGIVWSCNQGSVFLIPCSVLGKSSSLIQVRPLLVHALFSLFLLFYLQLSPPFSHFISQVLPLVYHSLLCCVFLHQKQNILFYLLHTLTQINRYAHTFSLYTFTHCRGIK